MMVLTKARLIFSEWMKGAHLDDCLLVCWKTHTHSSIQAIDTVPVVPGTAECARRAKRNEFRIPCNSIEGVLNPLFQEKGQFFFFFTWEESVLGLLGVRA